LFSFQTQSGTSDYLVILSIKVVFVGGSWESFTIVYRVAQNSGTPALFSVSVHRF